MRLNGHLSDIEMPDPSIKRVVYSNNCIFLLVLRAQPLSYGCALGAKSTM